MKLLHSILLRIAIATIVCVVASCSITKPKLVFHSFEFNANWDSPDIEVLDFKYGNSKNPGTHPPDWAIESRQIAQRSATGGYMKVGEFLFVKWKIKKTGEIFKDTVDLRNRLPSSLDDCTVYFVIRGPQLFVYLISPEHAPSGTPSNGLRIYGSRKVKTIYPG